MQDIATRADIDILVKAFYQQLLADEVVGVFFVEVIQLDWEAHIPVIIDFWESVLLGTSKYKGNPMRKHIALNEQKALEPAHFDRWLNIWEKTIRQHHSGTKAEEAIAKARNIGDLMQFKIKQHTNGYNF